MAKYIYFYDRNEVLLDRYPAGISQILGRNLGDDIQFVFLYSERLIKGGTPQKLPENSIVIYQPFLKLDYLDKLTKQYPPAAFINIALRIPDVLLIGYFNRLNVPTYMVQHGLFVKYLTRIPFIQHISSKFVKFQKYFIYSLSISKMIGKPFLKTLKELYACYIKGSKKFRELQTIKDSDLLSAKVFSFDTSWDSYYIDNYNYRKSQLIYFGNPDYTLVKECLANPVQDAICYICQSLVEDGRYLKKDFLAFLNGMKKNLEGKKVYLKLHPRSDVELYKGLEDENFVLTDAFENCDTYLGHYSSLLEISNQLDRNVILWNLGGHGIPTSYEKYGDLTTNNWGEVDEFLKNRKTSVFKIKEKVQEFLDMPLEPLDMIAERVRNDLNL
jgi:hypothetical protein